MTFVIKPTEQYVELQPYNFSVFLGGSIEMGKAVDWQTELATSLQDCSDDLILFNPRRDNWDSSWEQKIDNPQFNEQVTWELDHLDKADAIIFYFQPGTQSPITLLELGLYADTGKCVVVCPEGFWRKGNVDIVCERYGVPQLKSVDELSQYIKERHEANISL
jgi:hypothetical protein